MRQGENDMVMVTGQQPGLLAHQPALDLQPGTLGTQPMATGIVPYSFDMPLRTGLDMATQHRGATDQQRPCRLSHLARQRMAAFKRRVALLQNLLHRHPATTAPSASHPRPPLLRVRPTGRQARRAAEARYERTLAAVACTPWLGAAQHPRQFRQGLTARPPLAWGCRLRTKTALEGQPLALRQCRPSHCRQSSRAVPYCQALPTPGGMPGGGVSPTLSAPS